MDIFKRNPDKPWGYDLLSDNPTITMDFVNANPDKPWSYYSLSSNPNITIDNVLANPDRPWDYEPMSCNPNITMDFVLANPDKPWDWEQLSWNPNITMDIINANPDLPWDHCYVSRNPNNTMDIVKANPDFPWDYKGLIRNPNFTMEFVNANPDKPWGYICLSCNKLHYRKNRLPAVSKRQTLFLAYFFIPTLLQGTANGQVHFQGTCNEETNNDRQILNPDTPLDIKNIELDVEFRKLHFVSKQKPARSGAFSMGQYVTTGKSRDVQTSTARKCISQVVSDTAIELASLGSSPHADIPRGSPERRQSLHLLPTLGTKNTRAWLTNPFTEDGKLVPRNNHPEVVRIGHQFMLCLAATLHGLQARRALLCVDFGTAKLCTDSSVRKSYPGTEKYMAPKVDNRYSRPADVFCLGGIFSEIFWWVFEEQTSTDTCSAAAVALAAQRWSLLGALQFDHQNGIGKSP
ncbi:hypothetical protein BDK51DRAFT_48987 [Blyttiomyces helicus]|uniref:Protein kinase domain-containing protein n=1 Tax=Blyttiomyces helicus TaxID=388810 RepID=A0A4P9VYX2_9FUNG|nr:hypothetical protein BDK51DRAFT_48987 [Blyttiomyces helicus]|eukprot:RKO84492.1 hypothetical protein BDK51DRAFT_48987 [Blyttiomyces helicus]